MTIKETRETEKVTDKKTDTDMDRSVTGLAVILMSNQHAAKNTLYTMSNLHD